MNFNTTKASALKILGKDAKFPKLPGDFDKDRAAVVAAGKATSAARDALEKNIVTLKQAIDKMIDTSESYIDVFKGSDFGLNPKDKDQKKQIDDATKLLTSAFDGDLKDSKALKTVMDQIFKQISSIAKSIDAIS